MFHKYSLFFDGVILCCVKNTKTRFLKVVNIQAKKKVHKEEHRENATEISESNETSLFNNPGITNYLR